MANIDESKLTCGNPQVNRVTVNYGELKSINEQADFSPVKNDLLYIDLVVDFEVNQGAKDRLLSQISKLLSNPRYQITGTISLSGVSSDISKLKEALCQK